MEDGHLTDARGRKVDFRNTIIIMTSNIGAELIRRQTSLGFAVTKDDDGKARSDYEHMKDKVLGELKRTFRPEFLNRIDGVIVFHSLTREHVKQICDLMLARLRKQLAERDLTLELSDGRPGPAGRRAATMCRAGRGTCGARSRRSSRTRSRSGSWPATIRRAPRSLLSARTTD